MGTDVDMNGWHTAGAIFYSDVNQAIQEEGTSPESFDITASDGSASASGSFGTWQLTTGGAGQDIVLAVPIDSGTLTLDSDSRTLTPATASVMVRAEYVPGPDGRRALKVATSGTDVADVLNLEPAQSDFLVNAALASLLKQWLNENLGEFSQVFATVDMNVQFENEGIAWLKPSVTSYAVAEPQHPTPENSVFAVLCLIDGEEAPSDLAAQVSPYAIPENARGSFLIAPEKFLQHMMLAAVPLMFEGISTKPATEYFVIDNDGTRIRNTQKLTMQRTRLENGHEVNPSVAPSNFTIQVDTTELVITITAMGFTYSRGIEVSLNYEGRSILSYDAELGILDLTVTTQSGSGSVSVTKGMQIAEIVLGVATIVLSLVAAGGGTVARIASPVVKTAEAADLGAAQAGRQTVTGIQRMLLAAVNSILRGEPVALEQIAGRALSVMKIASIGAFCTGLMPAITQILQAYADHDYQSLPKITDLTDSAIGRAIRWPTAVPDLTLSSAQLNGALQFGLVRSQS